MKNIQNTTAKSIGWNTSAVILSYIIQFAVSVILARQLLPADFGIYGFAQIFATFVVQFSDLGLGGALVQRREMDSRVEAVGFTLRISLGWIFVGLLFGAAPILARFLHNPNAAGLIRLLAMNGLVIALAFLPQMMLTRNLAFGKLAIIQVASGASGAITTICLAMAGFGFWSLGIGSLVQYGTSTVIMNCLAPLRPRFGLDRTIANQLLIFGLRLCAPGIVVFLMFNIDNFIVGVLRGAKDLGYYAIAFNWGSMICLFLAGAVHRVLSPIFARMQDDAESLHKAYAESIRYVAFVTFAFNVALLVMGKELLYHLLGKGTDKWLPALPALQVLCVYGILRALIEPVVNVLYSVGRLHILLKANLLAAALEISLLYPAIRIGGLQGAAIAVLIAYASQYCFFLPVLKNEVSLTIPDFLRLIRPSFAAAGAMAIVLLAGKALLDTSMLGSAVIVTLFGILSYCIVHGVQTNWQIWKEFRRIVISS